MANTKYNGWTNYETWRVNLEVFDGYETDNLMDASGCRAFVEDIIDSTTSAGLARDYALAFLQPVDWDEIAAHVNEANDLVTAEA